MRFAEFTMNRAAHLVKTKLTWNNRIQPSHGAGIAACSPFEVRNPLQCAIRAVRNSGIR